MDSIASMLEIILKIVSVCPKKPFNDLTAARSDEFASEASVGKARQKSLISESTPFNNNVLSK